MRSGHFCLACHIASAVFTPHALASRDFARMMPLRRSGSPATATGLFLIFGSRCWATDA